MNALGYTRNPPDVRRVGHEFHLFGDEKECSVGISTVRSRREYDDRIPVKIEVRNQPKFTIVFHILFKSD